MRPTLTWIDRIVAEEHADVGCCINDLAFKPDGSELLIAVDRRILLYDGVDGILLQTLNGHKDVVYCVAWSPDGETFASGSADKTVILWTSAHEGTLKYSHSDAVQCLAFSPVVNVLLSCAMSDFGLWSAADKNVQKQRVSGRCCSCSWSSDGTVFAIGMFDGTVTIRRPTNVNDEPVAKIERPGGEPVWSLKFGALNKLASETMGVYDRVEDSLGEILCVTDWSQTMSFYDIEGRKVIPQDKILDFEPHCIEYFNDGQFMVAGGSNNKCTLYTRKGVLLGTVAQLDNTIWSITTKPKSSNVIVGCVDGTVASYNLMFTTVHGLHKTKYAYRKHMTNVIVQDLSKRQETMINCGDIVRKVVVYNYKLAAQLSDKIVIYRQTSGDKDHDRLEYKLQEMVSRPNDPTLQEARLEAICSMHFIMCTDRTLICYDQKGLKQMEWSFDSNIRYIRVVGGPPGKEMIICGMAEGQVYKIFVDNPFAVKLVQLQASVRCIDLSLSRTRLAVVDDSGLCSIYDSKTREVLLQEPGCQSVAFNAFNEDLIGYSGPGTLKVRTWNLPGFQQRIQGFVVGFYGNTVYCLYSYSMISLIVPFSMNLYQCIENKLYKEAYAIATLGVTESDWEILGVDALANFELDIAVKAFARMKDYRSLQLIQEIKDMKEAGENDILIKAHILSYQGRFREVAALYRENGYENKAMELFTDLRMFDDAQEVMTTASGETQKMLMRKRADWATNSNQPKIAAEMLIASGDFEKATQLIVENDWMDLAISIMKKLDRNDTDSLRRLAAYFVKKEDYSLASKIYSSINDTSSLVQMHVTAGHWTDAFAIANRYPKYVEDVYLPYARFLAEKDRFEEAQKAYHQAGRDQEAMKVLEQLTGNAVRESRFADAGYYHWSLSTQYLERSKEHPELIPKYLESSRLADIYYAYDAVYLFCNQPFTSHSMESLLNMARYLSFQDPVPNISRVLTFYTIAKIGRDLGAFKLAREALDNLSKLKIPARLEQTIDIMSLCIRAKPFSDAEDLLPMCYRCGLTNQLTGGLNCIHCQTPFVFSFATFEILPLLEFFVKDGIDPSEAISLIDAEPPLNDSNYNPFQGAASRKGGRVELDRDALARLEKSQVIVQSYPEPIPTRYLFNVMPTIALSKCPSCNKVFHMDDYEMAVLQKGACPFCRTTQTRTDNSYYLNDDD